MVDVNKKKQAKVGVSRCAGQVETYPRRPAAVIAAPKGLCTSFPQVSGYRCTRHNSDFLNICKMSYAEV